MKIELEIPIIKEQTEEERRDYCASIFAVFPKLEKDIKEMMYEQLIAIYSESIGLEKMREARDHTILRGNGIMEGMAMLLERWQIASSEHEAKGKSEGDFDKNSPISEI